jgi:hypothetical protein
VEGVSTDRMQDLRDPHTGPANLRSELRTEEHTDLPKSDNYIVCCAVDLAPQVQEAGRSLHLLTERYAVRSSSHHRVCPRVHGASAGGRRHIGTGRGATSCAHCQGAPSRFKGGPLLRLRVNPPSAAIKTHNLNIQLREHQGSEGGSNKSTSRALLKLKLSRLKCEKHRHGSQ